MFKFRLIVVFVFSIHMFSTSALGSSPDWLAPISLSTYSTSCFGSLPSNYCDPSLAFEKEEAAFRYASTNVLNDLQSRVSLLISTGPIELVSDPSDDSKVYKYHYSYGAYWNANLELNHFRKFVVAPTGLTVIACPITYPTAIDNDGDGVIDKCFKAKSCPVKTQSAAVESGSAQVPLANPDNLNQVGNPIQCSTGQKTQIDTIYQGTGSDPLSYTTHYESPKYEETNGALDQWFNSLQGSQRGDNQSRKLETLYNQADGKVFQTTFKNGFSHLFYGVNSASQLKGASLKSGNLTLEADGSYTQTMPNGTVYSFNSDGLLVTKNLANGKTRTYTYTPTGKLSTVTNHYGQQLKYFYNGLDLLSKLIDPEKQETFFEYDVNQNLTKIIYPDETPADLTDNPSITYLFENVMFPNHLTGKINEKGVRLATWNYDSNGQAISSEHGISLEKVELDYSIPNQTRVTHHVSDTLSSDVIYHYTTKYIDGSPRKQLNKYEQLTCTDCTVGSW